MLDNTKIATVYAQYGQAETFWDICFSAVQFDFIDIPSDYQRSISVWIQPENGIAELNNGYEPDSAPYEAENNLFNEYKDPIIEALWMEVPRTAEYARFIAAADADREARHERINQLAEILIRA